MKKHWGLMVGAAFLVGGCAGLKPDASTAPRVIDIQRAATAPAIDGRLDDACWQQARPVTDFLLYRSDRLAAVQTLGYVAYDDTHLYIGMKCLTAPGAKPVGKMRVHDANVFSDDVVEIMIDPGRTRADYYQLAINAYGATFDCARRHAGRDEDDAWNGDWEGKSFIGDGFWSAEIALPFHNLGLVPGIGSTWGINLCREARNPDELSSIGGRGEFNRAETFAVLRGLNADFSRYLIGIGPQGLVTEVTPAGMKANVVTAVRSLAGARRQAVRIALHRTGEDGREAVETVETTLERGRPINLTLDTVDVVPAGDGSGLFVLKARPRTRKIVVRDAGGTACATSLVRDVNERWQALRLHVRDPWGPATAGTGTTSLAVEVSTDLPVEQLGGRTLQVSLLDDKGRAIGTVTKPASQRDQVVAIDTREVPWGAYRVRAAFRDAAGESAGWTAEAPVVVLPGGKQRVRILNNLVSELMNARDRGLLGEREIPFVNPRQGWCFFAVSGTLAVRLDAEADPFVTAQAGAGTAEAMRQLAAGRHVLRLEGMPEQIVVRAVPALQHAFYGADPHIAPYGPYDWEFLARDVRPNVNVMISSGPPAPEHISAWKQSGRSWLGITNVFIPDFEAGAPDAAAKAYQHWAGSIGFTHPLMDGAIVDEFGGGDDRAYDAYREAVEKLHADFPGRIYMPYGGVFYGLDRSREFARAALAGGGYVCPEHYLPEQRTEAEARRLIEDSLVSPMDQWERGLPGSVRRMVLVLGYMSQPTESLNVDPTVDFKVYMDMQFRALATAPACFGLGGLQEYHSSYADEESVRWAGRLYRHYAIEGRTEPLTHDPYKLAHLRNPDFEAGTDGWTVEAAEPGSVKPLSFAGYGWLQGRYPRTTQGDTFLWTRRSAAKPNVFSQTVRDLVPGRLYSLKLIAADYGALTGERSVKAPQAISIRLDRAEVLPGPKNSFQFTFPNCYAHKLGKFNAKYPYWMNYHWRVFRAAASTATLQVTDWESGAAPGGPIGQEVMFSFVEIQPYIGE